MRNRLLALAALAGLAVPLGILLPSATTAAATAPSNGTFANALRTLGQGASAPLRDIPAQPVAAGHTGSFPYRPVTHRHVPGATATYAGSIQTSASTSTDAPTAGSGFDGNTNTDGVLPPDTNGDIGYDAAGNAWYVQWVNLHYQMWERQKGQTTWTSKLAASGNTVFSALNNLCSTTNDGDPVVVYDRMAQRWVLTQFAFDSNWLFGTPTAPYGQCVAVSQTSDPTGAYNLYSWDVGHFSGADYFPDYPKLGVWPNGYYLTFNYFSGQNLNTFNGPGIVILDRTAMLNGQPAQANATGPMGSSIASLLPVTVDESAGPASSTPESLAAVDTNSTAGGSNLQWWHVSNVTWGSSVGASLARLADIPVDPYNWYLCSGSRNCIPQPGTSVGLDTLSDRLMYRAGYRVINGVEHVVLTHTVNVANSGTDAAIRWYDITNVSTTPTVSQQSTYAPDTTNRWMGSAAMDSAGDIAVGYSASSSSVYPSIRYAGQAVTDARNVLGAESTIKAGGGSQTHSSSRWGDYSSLVVDPVDGCTFWYTNEYYTGTSSYSWRTWVGSFTFPNCGSTGTTQPPAAPTGLTASATPNTSDQVDLSWTGSSGATSYNVYRGGALAATAITATTYHDTGRTPSTAYSYTVSAVNGAGEGPQSAVVSVTTNPPPPSTVTAGAVSSSEIDLTWSSVSTASSYTVERSPTGSGPWTQVASGLTGTSWNDTGLSTGTTYYYRVRSVGSNGAGGPSNAVSATTSGVAPPTAFTLSASAPNKSTVALTWTSAGTVSYTVYRRKGSKGQFTSLATCSNITATTCTDTSVSAATTYQYYVSATNTAGSLSSNTVSVRTPKR